MNPSYPQQFWLWITSDLVGCVAKVEACAAALTARAQTAGVTADDVVPLLTGTMVANSVRLEKDDGLVTLQPVPPRGAAAAPGFVRAAASCRLR